MAAQGGINAAKNYRNDGDSVRRLFYDTVKGGDFRSRESNVYRLAQISTQIIDQCVAQGVPFAREYGGLLDNRSFGGVQVSRTFYARGQTGQQLLLGAYQALSRQIDAGNVEMHARTEMLDLIVVDGRARGIVARDLVTGEVSTYLADAVVLATGGYGNVFYLSTNAKGSNASAIWRAHKRGAYLANPCFTQIHPTCIPRSGEHQGKLTLMSESLRNDGRIWVPAAQGRHPLPRADPRGRAGLLPRADLPLLRQPGAPRHRLPRGQEPVRRGPRRRTRRPRRLPRLPRCDQRGWAGRRSRRSTATSSTCTSGSRRRTRTRCRCGSTRRSTTRWAACGSTTTCRATSPGLFVIGEANFSDHGANRLGASALMQGLADGYFVLPSTLADYLARNPLEAGRPRRTTRCSDRVRGRRRGCDTLLSIRGHPDGRLLPPGARHPPVGAMRNGPQPGRTAQGPGADPRTARGVLAERRWSRARGEQLNQELEKANRVADFLEFAELMVLDALVREESCGGHFREESQTPDGEALRDDEHFSHVSAWEYTGAGLDPVLHKEQLEFEYVHPKPAELRVNITVRIWRQAGPEDPGELVAYRVDDASPDMSFLEMLDVLNEGLILAGEQPVAFDHDCREGICGSCGVVIGGLAHGPGADHDVPAAHAQLLRRRCDRCRAVAIQRLSGDQGPHRRPLRVRPDHPVRRLYHRPNR